MATTGFTTTFAEFNRQMQRKVDILKLNAKDVVVREAGQLALTLMKITPPKDPKRTRDIIETKLSRKFAGAMNPSRTYENTESSAWGGDVGKKRGSGDVFWYVWTPTALYGVSKEAADYRNANEQGVYRLLFETTAGGKTKVGQRGKQRVYITQKYLVKPSMVKKVIARVKRHVGRLKAGWAVSWQDVGSPTGTVASPPQWVMKHAATARSLGKGQSQPELGLPGGPTFTLINRNAGARTLEWLIRDAMKIRAKAMATQLLRYWKGQAVNIK